MDIPIQTSAGKTLTPQMPTEPTPEAKAMEFKMPDSELFGDNAGTLTIDHKPVEEIKPEIKPEVKIEKEVKPEVKIEEAKKVVEKKSVLKPPTDEKLKIEETKTEVKPVIKPISPVKEVKASEQDSFDYSKYAPAEVTNMKNMSRPSREAYSKLIDDNKRLSALENSTYLQHEQAYTLSPDYQALQVNNYRAQIEGQCWEKSLLDIRAGKEFQEITGFDKNNNPIFSAPRKPTDRDEIRVSNNMSLCINKGQEFNGQLQQFSNQFKQRVQQDQQAINQYERDNFAWVSDPSLLEHSITIDGIGDKKVKDIISEVKGMFPIYDRNSTGAKMTAHLAVALIIRNAELKEALNGQQVAQIQKEEIQRAEPSSDTRETKPANTNGAIPKDFSLGEMAESLGIRI